MLVFCSWKICSGLDSPEVVVASGPDFVAVTQKVGHETWSKITGKVDSITGFPTEACTNSKDDKEQAKRCKRASTDVSVVFQSVDQEHKECAGNEFGEKLTLRIDN